jgi:hypothetical protein
MKYIITLFLFFCFFVQLKSQDTLSHVINSSFQGKHFYIGFMQNENYLVNDTNLLVLYIAPTASANVNVNLVTSSQNYQIEEDSVLAIVIPKEFEMRESEFPKHSAIEITSDVPITVYTFNTQYTTTESYAAIPVDKWGKEYVAISYPNDQYQDDGFSDSLLIAEPRSSEFMVIAAYDTTTIQFQPKAITTLGKQTYKNYTVKLNKGECYLVKSMKSQRGTADLSGTIVRSKSPLAFYPGM